MTLDELIDACGPDFNLVEKGEKAQDDEPDTWIAIGRLGELVTAGSTPEEAVEKLRLALHE